MAHRWDPKAPHPRRLVLPVRLDPTGELKPTPGQARGPRWRRTSQGFYAPTTTRRDLPEQRIAEAAVRLSGKMRITGWAACRLHGANFFDGLARDGRTQLGVGIEVVRVTGAEIDNESLVVERVRAGRTRAKFQAQSQRLGKARPQQGTLHDRLVDRTLTREFDELSP